MIRVNPIFRSAKLHIGLQCALLIAACAMTAATARASVVTTGPPLTSVPGALFDPLGSLSLTPSQFLVPVQVSGADGLDLWQFDLHFDPAVAAPTDVGGLYQSVYQADFGTGAISQITSSGFLFDGVLDDVSGYFAPAVSGGGPLAYVLFDYLPGQDGKDPGIYVGEAPPTQAVPEPSALSLMLVTAGAGALVARSRRRSATLPKRS
jgi:hypothetical protein